MNCRTIRWLGALFICGAARLFCVAGVHAEGVSNMGEQILERIAQQEAAVAEPVSPSPGAGANAKRSFATDSAPLPPQSADWGYPGTGLYSFRAENTDIQQALAMFARANNLNIVPDPDVVGQITVDVRDLPLEAVMRALLSAHGYFWEEEDSLIRIHTKQTRMFIINYPRLVRSGDGYSAASLSGASAGNASGGGGGGSGGGGGGGGGSGGGGGAAAGGSASGAATGSGTSITQQDNIDFWKELDAQLSMMISPGGKVILDKMSGIVQVTDRRDVVENIATYLELMQQRTHRQVDIEARIYEVTLSKEFQLGVDWKAISDHPRIAGLLSTNSIVQIGAGGLAAALPAFVAIPAHQGSSLNVSAIVHALQEQGHVSAISQPRLRSLNNQMAVIKVGTEQPFFNTQSGFIAGTGGSPGGTFENTSFDTITVGTILSVTPQISEDDYITLDISPVVSSLVSIESSGQTTAPVLDIKQSSSLVRVKSGDTIVIGGLIQDKISDTSRRIPLLGGIPVVGVPFRGTIKGTQKTELVIFLTPTILSENASPASQWRQGPTAFHAPVPTCESVPVPQLPATADPAARQVPAISTTTGKRTWKRPLGAKR